VNRNVIAISIASFMMAFGEELWKRVVFAIMVEEQYAG